MEHNCNFCNKTFKSKSSLNYHKKTAKNCIQSRGLDDQLNIQTFKCDYCNKECTTRFNLNLHLASCKEFLIYKKNEDLILKVKEMENQLNIKDNIIKEIKDEMKNLQEKFTEMANHAIEKSIDKTTYSNENEYTQNNQINNKNQDTYNTVNYHNLPAVDLSDENLQKTFEKLTDKDVCEGQNGLAAFIDQNLFRDSKNRPIGYCTDKARQMMLYKGANNQIIRDPKAYKIVCRIAPFAEKAALRVKDEFVEKHYKNKPNPPKIEEKETSEESEEEKEFDFYSNRKVYLPNNFKNSFLRKKLCKMVCRRSIFNYDEEKNEPVLRSESESNRYESIISRLINKINTTAKIVKKKKKKKVSRRRNSDSDSDSEYETDYEKYLDGIEEEDFFAEEDLRRQLEKLDREKNENRKQEKAEEIVNQIEEKEWPQEKKDFYLQKLINGIQDYQMLTINLCNFSKRLSLLLPSEN